MGIRVVRASIWGVALAATAFALNVPAARAAGPASPAIITNGTVTLGINPEGHLNVSSPAVVSAGDGDGATWAWDANHDPVLIGEADDYDTTTVTGLRQTSSQRESTAPDYLGEGWGVAAYEVGDDALNAGNAIANGYADADPAGGVSGLICDSFTADADSAISTTHVEDVGNATVLEVVHDWRPTASPFLYEGEVRITNRTNRALNVRYRRVMDWDPEPTPFWEFSSMSGTVAALAGDLEFCSNDGFTWVNADSAMTFDTSADEPPVPELLNQDFTDNGPDDQGAVFGFKFDGLAAGATRTFFVYYGVAPDTAQMQAALAQLGITLYSLAKPTDEDGTPGDPSDDSPIDDLATFAFGFRQVGEQPCATTCLWPPNHKFEDFDTFLTFSIPGLQSVTITSITSDEDPCLAPGAGGKKKFPDAKIEATPGTFSLRVERSGKGNGRVYGVSFTGTDSQGGTVTGTKYFCVPHDQSPPKSVDGCCNCTDDGQKYDATGGC